MAMPTKTAVKVIRIASDPSIATNQINDAIKAIEDAGGTNVSTGVLFSDTLILTYAPAGADSSSDSEDDGGEG